jgi:putative Mg2+ transporter-C (MgtC) family protein
MGAALLMQLSIFIPQTYSGFAGGDPGRIASQVVAGMGLLGAGAIIRLGVNVRGVTTAASIWTIAAVGLALGAGLLVPAFALTGLILFVLVVFDFFEKRLVHGELLRVLQVCVNSTEVHTERTFGLLKRYGITINSFDISQSFQEKTVCINMVVKVPGSLNHDRFFAELQNIPGISEVNMKQSM